jgi:Transposase DDE domain
MTSVSQAVTAVQRQQFGEIESNMQALFQQKAECLAQATGFVQRHSKITGSAFAQTLVFGFLNQPEARYTDLQQILALQGVQASPQALEERMTPQAASFMRYLLEETVSMAIRSQECTIPTLHTFAGVYLQDGTIVTLPDALQEQWRGSGYAGGQSGLRVQLRINWMDGKISGPWLQDARASENTGEASIKHTDVPKGALYVTDSGYLIIKRMRELDAQGVFWLAPAKANLLITDEQGIKRDLPSFVACQPEGVIDRWVFVGAEKLWCRLLVFPADNTRRSQQSKYDQKIRVKGSRHDVQVGRHKTAKGKKGRKSSQETPQHRRLKGAVVLLSNAPVTCLSAKHARVVMRVRWQIELIWKLWKQYGKVDVWRSEKSTRILCEVYAKLIAMILQHWFTIVGCWSDPHRSLVKASRLIQKGAPCIMLTMHGPLTQQALFQLLCLGMKGCTMNSRKKHPNTSQHLLTASG